MLQFTGRRKPILISGAGKVVDGILRQRPCFFIPLFSRILFSVWESESQVIADSFFTWNYFSSCPFHLRIQVDVCAESFGKFNQGMDDSKYKSANDL